jgi:hypothetical protein
MGGTVRAAHMASDDFDMVVQTDDGPVRVAIARPAVARRSGRSHVTPEEVASAYRMEIEAIVRDKLIGSAKTKLRLNNSDFWFALSQS